MEKWLTHRRDVDENQTSPEAPRSRDGKAIATTHGGSRRMPKMNEGMIASPTIDTIRFVNKKMMGASDQIRERHSKKCVIERSQVDTIGLAARSFRLRPDERSACTD